mmetsp:Transcript_542/g.478  ORF Transcript_542/g.478 Transcript_542/m.478 type:complete len:93 (+) Transcript_542:966-1244(+)|eukprot:CAMPEP_0205802404 /NCGR_PEP_ID=MMETSP0205-20121125/4703_1 /ASSEMBLY_ACC=CAM_ASM_000278 /TAXON_ID=36767 /ORGANISM="Euplotes focardii, Strain TN1" /LENGTH=92 /DNA_ID=CAMNT_0053068739 /DNA_START=917 /DNA_END=1195 /DNA_ORIENTATION=-
MKSVKRSKLKELNRTEQEWEEILHEIDKDGNDEINFDEFIEAMEKVIHPEANHPKAEEIFENKDEDVKQTLPPIHQNTNEPGHEEIKDEEED